jgi:anti-sigma factor RsiW
VSPYDVAVALLAGPLEDRRFRKVTRHLAQKPAAAREFFEALESMTTSQNVSRIREGLARAGVEVPQ